MLLVHGGDDELGVVDEAALVGVDRVEHLLNLDLVQVLAEEEVVPFENLLEGELAVAVLVDGLEDFGEVLLLALGQELTGDEGEGGLLELLVSSEALEVGEGSHGLGRVDDLGAHLDDPGVLEGVRGRRSLVGVVGEESGDQVLALLGDVGPGGVGERELSNSDLLHDLLVAGAVEGGHSGEDDVEHDSARPDVALLVVLLVEDLGSDVVGGAEFFVERLGGIIYQRRSKVYNLYLIKILVLLQENIFRLQVPMIELALG